MNCDLSTCGKHILATTQVVWNGGNYHADCAVEAVNQNRAETEVPKSEVRFPDAHFEQMEKYDEDLYEGENLEHEDDIDEFEEDFADAIARLDHSRVIPEIVEADKYRTKAITLPPGSIQVASRAIINPPVNGSLVNGAKGSRFVTFPELKTLPLPEATATFKPIPFYDFVTKVLDGLYDRRMRTIEDRYIISADGMKLFGLIELEQEYDGVRFAVGLRSSNDKSMKLALACGYKVMCCSNGMLSGDFMPLSVKHSANLDIDDALALGIDRIRRRFGNVQLEIAEKKVKELSDRQAESLIYKAFTYGKFPVSLFRNTHKEYFIEPSYKEFAPRTLFSLENAFTTSFKKLQPMQQFEQTSRLAKFLQEHKN